LARVDRQNAEMTPYAEELWSATCAAVPAWVRRDALRLLAAAGVAVTPELDLAIADACAAAQAFVASELREMLELDVDQQRTNPLAVLRSAVRFQTGVLSDAGVPHVRRDEFAERAFPHDHYGLAPAAWLDIDESLHEPGIIWGAWKAKTVLDRRRAEGRR
jgi:hypothetical protein